MRLTLALIRLLMLGFSFVLATLASALFMTFALFLNAEAEWLNDDPLVTGGAFLFAMVAWLAAMKIAFLPALAAILTLEFTRWTSLTANLLAGGAVAVTVLALMQSNDAIETTLPYGIRDVSVAIIASGFIGGVAHWVIAGHRAGRWLGPEAADRDKPV